MRKLQRFKGSSLQQGFFLSFFFHLWAFLLFCRAREFFDVAITSVFLFIYLFFKDILENGNEFLKMRAEICFQILKCCLQNCNVQVENIALLFF